MRKPALFNFYRDRARIRIQLRQPIMVVLTISAFAWYLMEFTSLSAVVFSVLLTILLGSYAWARSLAVNVSAQRKVRYGAVQVGDELEETIQLVNNSILPVVWAEFMDRSSLPGYNVGSVRAIGGESKLEWTAGAVCSRRGVFTLGPWEIVLGDPMGIFQVRIEYSDPVEILVYPEIGRLPAGYFSKRGQTGEMSRMNQPKTAETLLAFGVRNYYPGDPLKRVHWPTTARKNELFVKSFEPEAVNRIYIILDLDSHVQVSSGSDIQHDTVEFMAMLAATLTGQFLKDKIGVGFLAAGAPLIAVSPECSQMQYWRILREIARMAAKDKPLVEVLQTSKQLLSRNQMAMVITPSTDVHWVEMFNEVITSRSLVEPKSILIDGQSFGELNLLKNDRMERLRGIVRNSGIQCEVMGKGDLSPIQSAYGRLSRWEFRTLGTGRVIVKQRPGGMPIPGEIHD